MGAKRWAALFSTILIIGSLLIFAINGIKLGLDFTGGTQFQLAFENPIDPDTVREQLKTVDLPDVVVQRYGGAKTLVVRVGVRKGLEQEALKAKVQQAVPDAKLMSVEFIGPKVGKRLATSGALAFIVAMLGTAFYIAIRFEYRFAVSATAALLHDPILILGIFSLFHIEFDLVALAAILTVVGYSLNDTIVVFDRVRENFRKLRKSSPTEVMNISVNQTLSRTIMTSGLTLLAVVSLYLYGGEVVHAFALALIIGIVIGTYSSIYVAGALALALGTSRTDLMPTPKEVIDDRP